MAYRKMLLPTINVEEAVIRCIPRTHRMNRRGLRNRRRHNTQQIASMKIATDTANVSGPVTGFSGKGIGFASAGTALNRTTRRSPIFATVKIVARVFI